MSVYQYVHGRNSVQKKLCTVKCVFPQKILKALPQKQQSTNKRHALEMNFLLLMVAVIAAAHLWTEAHGFVPQPPVMLSPTPMVYLQMLGGNSDLPYGPPPGADNPTIQNVNSAAKSNNDDNARGATLKGNRFSKYAPDASLDTADFRTQLKENMKADLERRRREDPNRGNQPAKTYLDNL